MPGPPVESITPVRRCRISSFVPWIVASPRHWTMPFGAPASSAARESRAAVSQVQRIARGWGLSTIAFRDFSEMRLL